MNTRVVSATFIIFAIFSVLFFWASELEAQAVLNPNQITGKIEFTNINPEILELLDPEGGDKGFDYLFVRADSVGVSPSLNNYGYPRANGAISSTYQITVESSHEGIAYNVSAEARMDSYRRRYLFDRLLSEPVYPEPEADVTVNFKQCLTMLDIRFIDEAGNPVNIEGGNINAYREVTNEYGYTYYRIQAQAFSLRKGIDQAFLAVEGDGSIYKINTTYEFGNDPYKDKTRFLCQEYVIADCDKIEEVLCVIPEGGELGAITGNIDMVGSDEHPTYSLTKVRAERGPFNNYRWDHLDSVPAQGKFLLPNLLPSDADKPAQSYTLWGEMAFGKGYQSQYYRTPWLNKHYNEGVYVEAGKTSDLGDIFVFNPGHLKGEIKLAGPQHAGSCMQYLYRSADNDCNKDGIPNNAWLSDGSAVEASGSYRLAPGATMKAFGALARASFAGNWDSKAGLFLGNYDMLLGALKDEPALWRTKSLVLAFRNMNNLAQSEDYRYSRLVVRDAKYFEREIKSGSASYENHAYCLSEVKLSYRSLSGLIYQPQVWANGSFQGDDFESNSADYRVSVYHAYGTPRSQSQAADKGQVSMCLPQGNYKFTPKVRAINPNGTTSYTELRPVELEVGCKQLIEFTTSLQINLDKLPQLTDQRDLGVSGNVESDGNVTHLKYSLNDNTPVTLCNDCGEDPDFTFDLDLRVGDNKIVVLAEDEFDNKASVSSHVVFDPKDVSLAGCEDFVVHAPKCEDRAAVEFDVQAVPGCDAKPSLSCDAKSGDFFALGKSEVTCVAEDSCGTRATCTFNVEVLKAADNEGCSGEAPPEEKVVLCHIPPGNPKNAHSIEVGTSAVSAHLAHGDKLGKCEVDDDEDDDSDDEDDEEEEKPEKKVVICHIPPGNPENAHTIEVAESAVEAHLAHGDKLGECNDDDDGDDDDDDDSCLEKDLLPTVTCAVDAPVLWPPDHKFIEVGYQVQAKHSCKQQSKKVLDADFSFLNTRIWSDETEVPQPKDYSGRHAPDARFYGSKLMIRSERRGREDGRVYLMVAEGKAKNGKRAFACCTVAVPQNVKSKAIKEVAVQAAAALAYCQANNGAIPAGFTEHGVSEEIGPQKERAARNQSEYASNGKKKSKRSKSARQKRRRLKSKADRGRYK